MSFNSGRDFSSLYFTNYRVAHQRQPNYEIDVTVTSSNEDVVPVENITVGGLAPNCTFIVTPAPAATGTSDITFTLSDGVLSDSQAFVSYHSIILVL